MYTVRQTLTCIGKFNSHHLPTCRMPCTMAGSTPCSLQRHSALAHTGALCGVSTTAQEVGTMQRPRRVSMISCWMCVCARSNARVWSWSRPSPTLTTSPQKANNLKERGLRLPPSVSATGRRGEAQRSCVDTTGGRVRMGSIEKFFRRLHHPSSHDPNTRRVRLNNSLRMTQLARSDSRGLTDQDTILTGDDKDNNECELTWSGLLLLLSTLSCALSRTSRCYSIVLAYARFEIAPIKSRVS